MLVWFFFFSCWRKRVASSNQENKTRRNLVLLEHVIMFWVTGKVISKPVQKEGVCTVFSSSLSYLFE